jgi:hypothetical protein
VSPQVGQAVLACPTEQATGQPIFPSHLESVAGAG